LAEIKKEFMKKITTLFLSAAIGGFLFSNTLGAQQLFKDLLPGPHPASSNPLQYMNVGSSMYIVTWQSGYYPYKLWITDGTAANTTLVKDSIITTNLGDRVEMVASMNNYMYYIVRQNDGYTQELWKTDGTTAGTTLVTDISYSTSGGWPAQNFITMGNEIFFQHGAPGGHGRELWKTDGTAAGTVEVIDLDPGSSGGSQYAGMDNRPMVVYNGKLYFSGATSLGNYELFSSDGTAAGTALIQELTPGVSGSEPDDWETLNNELYFTADNGSYNELWKTDGVTATKLTTSTVVGAVTSFSNAIYFNGGTNLWKSDGTVAGTVVVPGTTMSDDFTGATPTYLFFGNAQFIPTPPYYIYSYFRSDGTAAGTISVPYDVAKSASYNVLGNDMYITRLDSGSFTNVGVWKSDGTVAGTSKILVGYGTGFCHVFNNDVFFSNIDPATGGEPWHLGAPVGIPSVAAETGGRIYPNPSFGVFTVKIKNAVSDMNVEVYDMMGKKVLTVHGTDSFDLSTVAKGIYFVQVKDGKENYTQKIVVQ
jgi:ELWxxDGT repeat protein